MKFDNSYIRLGEAFYQRISPSTVTDPELFLWNKALADSLSISPAEQQSPNLLANYFSGNQLPAGADPIALAYAGHQFGHFNPQLGDGRAHLLGEIIDKQGQRLDIQLKGSGPTRFSRQGDGRCALGPAIREYIMSEAMHALGVPTTRSLAVVTSGEMVYRDPPQPGAIVTRVASSHLRVGTFQYFAAQQDIASLSALTNYAIERHFPEAKQHPTNKVVGFLELVIEQQIKLVVEWLRVGFIHGVMNTDNCAISGETIDFGPCAMLGIYDPATVYSSIDRQGRYAFANQPTIAQWNMARLAEALLPLIDPDQDKALQQAEPLIQAFSAQFEQAYFAMLAGKIGLNHTENIQQTDKDLIQALLNQMRNKQMDYTHTFDRLTCSLDDNDLASALNSELGDWYQQWQTRLQHEDINLSKAIMRQHNPRVIPRNHHIEAVLAECIETGNNQAADAMLAVLRDPYSLTEHTHQYQDLPKDADRYYRTFCGT